MEYGQNNQKQAAQYIATLLHAVTGVHMLHLMAKGNGSFAEHMALGALYDGLQDAVDGLAEEYFGCYGMVDGFPNEEFHAPTESRPYVEAVYQYILKNRKRMGDATHVQNSIDSILTLVSTTIYKLKYLK